MHGILISREPDKLSQTGDLRAVPAVECPIAPAGPEGQAWPRKCYNRVPLGLCQHTFFQRSLDLFLRPLETAKGALFILGQGPFCLLLRGLNGFLDLP